jgi:hypothetical protein
MPAIRVWQEIHCTKSGGGCGGFILLKLNIGLDNHRVEVTCPKCGHKHIRLIHQGMVTEKGRFSSDTLEELCPPLSAWSQEPRSLEMKQQRKVAGFNERDGVAVKELEGDEMIAQQILRESWASRVLGKLVGK